MKNFSIKELATLSGIKAHTIRVWEKRYNVLHPQRNKTNVRNYTTKQLEQLLKISLLNKNGYRISQLTLMNDVEIGDKINLLKNNTIKEVVINELIIYMYTMNVVGFEKTLNKCFFVWPIKDVIKDIIFIFLKKTRLLWRGNDLSSEHFAVTVIRNKLILAIEKTELCNKKDSTILLFLPEGNHLGLLLLYIHYHLKTNGWPVLYMGVNVSNSNLKMVFQIKKPDFIFTYLPRKNQFPLNEICTHMKSCVPQSKFIFLTHPPPTSMKNDTDNLLPMDFEDVVHFFN